MPIESFAFAGPLEPLVRGLALTIAAVLWTVLLVRIVGLRSFSKMTNYDFVATIATGSIIAQAGTRADWLEFAQAMAAIAAVFAIQYTLARGRQASDAFRHVVRNRPVLLMENGRFLDAALDATRVSRANILEKLRAADSGDIDRVAAVVLETTGDISVLTGNPDPRLLDGVERIDAPA
jgi:uncharacterized membrane protein YcaP (DUF421 family)